MFENNQLKCPPAISTNFTMFLNTTSTTTIFPTTTAPGWTTTTTTTATATLTLDQSQIKKRSPDLPVFPPVTHLQQCACAAKATLVATTSITSTRTLFDIATVTEVITKLETITPLPIIVSSTDIANVVTTVSTNVVSTTEYEVLT